MENKLIVKVNGSFETCINFSKKHKFDLGDGYKLMVPTGKDIGIKKYFELTGNVKSEIANEKEIKSRINKFMSWLSFYFNVPSDSIIFSGISIQQGRKGFTTSERFATVKGCIVVQDTDICSFEKIINIKKHADEFELFRKCRTEDPCTSFWFIYIILQILVGERKSIDCYLKCSFPEMKVLYNDKKKQYNSLFIAIRDAFSHKHATFSGEELNPEKELIGKIDYFRSIARRTIAKKLKLKLPK
jgi:hypothetical protein